MKMTITGRKVTVRPSFVERTEKKLSKLDKFFEDSVTADVTVSKENANKQRVEITIRTGGLVFRAEEACEDANEAVDRLVDVLLRQIRKNKTRLEKRLRKDAFDAYPEESYFIPESDEEEEPSYQLVRTKRFFFRPMSIDEAILQMNLVNHTFFAFRNEDDGGAFSVVYKRKDGGYGIIVDQD